MDFFKKAWVRIVAIIALIISSLALILGGTEIGKITELITIIGTVASSIITIIIGFIQKKDGKNNSEVIYGR